jgi:hypothetical protein
MTRQSDRPARIGDTMAGGYVRKMLEPSKILAMLRQYPIFCDDHGRDTLTVKTVQDVHNQKVMDLTADRQAQDYLHLAKDARISWFDLRPEVQANGKPWLKLHLEYQATSAVHTSHGKPKNLRPIFYLPYKQNAMTRMKLAAPGTYAGPDVTFFATATINGCSVYIEGPGATPRVTHGNAGDYKKPKGHTWEAKEKSIAKKTAFMDVRFAPLKKTASATVAARPDYMAARSSDVQAALLRYAAVIGLPPERFEIEGYNAIGAVVGLRQNGSWKFYLQRSASFNYRTKPNCVRGCKCGCKAVSGYAVLSAEELWPGGTGTFRTV